MQIPLIEFAKNVIGWKDANSIEFNMNTKNSIIYLLPDKIDVEDIGGTLRLGSYPCIVEKNSKRYKLFGTQNINERHYHRYEVNNEYRDMLVEHGLTLAGLSPDGRIVEMNELKDHPFYVSTQSHPEFKSRLNNPNPLFKGFVEAYIETSKK